MKTHSSIKSQKSIKPKKLLFIISEDWYFISHRFYLAKYAKSQGYEVHLLTKVTKHEEIIKKSGINLMHWPIKRRSANLLSELSSIKMVLKAIRIVKPDIIHAVALKPILYGAIGAKIFNIKSRVFAFAGLGYMFSSSQYLARFLKPILSIAIKVFLHNKSSIIIAQNQDDINLLLAHNIANAEQIKLIRGSGVDTEQFKQRPSNSSTKPIILLPARLLWDKGIGDFVRASTIFQKKDLTARFVVAGRRDDDNPESIPKDIIDGWKANNLLEVMGHVEDMPALYNSSSIVCLPSYREGLPKSLLEAASSSKPIVAYDVAGCREVVMDGENGILVQERDHQALAQALELLLKNSNLRASMGSEGRRMVENYFSQEEIAFQTEKVWNHNS